VGAVQRYAGHNDHRQQDTELQPAIQNIHCPGEEPLDSAQPNATDLMPFGEPPKSAQGRDGMISGAPDTGDQATTLTNPGEASTRIAKAIAAAAGKPRFFPGLAGA